MELHLLTFCLRTFAQLKVQGVVKNPGKKLSNLNTYLENHQFFCFIFQVNKMDFSTTTDTSTKQKQTNQPPHCQIERATSRPVLSKPCVRHISSLHVCFFPTAFGCKFFLNLLSQMGKNLPESCILIYLMKNIPFLSLYSFLIESEGQFVQKNARKQSILMKKNLLS